MSKMAKTTIDPEIIECARQVKIALDAALAMAAEGSVTAEDLPDLPDLPDLHVDPVVQLSPDVAKAVAACKASREAFSAETQRARSAAIVLTVISSIGKALLPGLGLLLKCVLLAAVLTAAVGCDSPAVQVGPTSQPAVTVDADAEVGLAAVDARRDVDQAGEASPAQHASRDARQTALTVNVSGSAWPLVAAGAMGTAGLLAVLYLRAQIAATDAGRRELAAAHNVDRAQREYSTVEANAKGVARAIQEMAKAWPPHSVDALLEEVRLHLPDPKAWDDMLDRSGLRVARLDVPENLLDGLAGPEQTQAPDACGG